ncbi:MAG TPA: DUF222 domain-containing protein [Mycobacteriales bacterium]|nr:DUF222 domain-containing protein [Mycobacteriales bacterium]
MSNAVALVEQFSALLDLCGGVDWSALSDSEVDEVLVRGFRQVGRFTGTVLLPLVREAEARGLASAHDAPDMRAWLQGSVNMRPAEAGRLLRLATALDSDLPKTAAALADGASASTTRR